MNDTLNKLEYQDSEISKEIDDALQRNVEKGLGKTGLSGILSQEVVDAKERGEIEGLQDEPENIRVKYAGRNILNEVFGLGVMGVMPNYEERRMLISKGIGCEPDQISFTESQAMIDNDIVFHYGDLDFSNLERMHKFIRLPLAIGGCLNLYKMKLVYPITFPQEVATFVELYSLESAENVVLPRYVGTYLNLCNLKKAENLTLPEVIGNNLRLDSLESAKDLVLPRSIGGSIFLQGLGSIDDLDLSNINQVQGIYLPKVNFRKNKRQLESIYPNLTGKFIKY